MKHWLIIFLTGILMPLGCVGQILKVTGQITDAESGRFYLQFDDNSFTEFMEVDLLTGQHLKHITVKSFKHIEECRFKNDRLYFLFQPDYGNQLKKVYSISI